MGTVGRQCRRTGAATISCHCTLLFELSQGVDTYENKNEILDKEINVSGWSFSLVRGLSEKIKTNEQEIRYG